MAFLDSFNYDTIENSGTQNSAQRRKYAAASDNYVKQEKEMRLTNLKKELQTIDNDLDAAYMQIGRRFMERARKTNDLCGLEIKDILHMMSPKMEKKKELEKQILAIKKGILEMDFLREKEKAELEYQEEKTKLDNALEMDILTRQEYEERLNVARKKAYNFDEIRRIKQQYDMGLISLDEKNEKIKQLTT